MSFNFQCKGQPIIVTRQSIQMIYYHVFLYIFCIVTVEREKTTFTRLPFKESVRILSHLPLNLYYVTKTWSWRCRHGVKLSVFSAKCFKLLFCILYSIHSEPFCFQQFISQIRLFLMKNVWVICQVIYKFLFRCFSKSWWTFIIRVLD